MPATTSSCDFEILLPDAVTWLPVMLRQPRNAEGMPIEGKPKTLQEMLAAARNDTPLAEWLETTIFKNRGGGFGVDYNHFAGGDSFSSPDHYLPFGASTEITVTVANNSASPIVAFCEFGGDLWIAQQGTSSANTARVMHMNGGTADPTNALNLGAGQYMRDLLVADDGAGVKVLWASSSDINGANGRLHKCVDPTTPTVWTSYAVYGTNGRNRMKSQFWVDEEGIGAVRIITSSSNQGHISYLKPDADPGLAASWVEGVRTPATSRVSLAAARRHVWMRDDQNVYDLNEQGDTPALLDESTRFFGTDYDAVTYSDDYVYISHATGVARVYVGNGPQLQTKPGTCSPGHLTKTRSIYANGYCTSLLPYQGGILAAMYPPGAAVPVVFYGLPKGSYDPDKENALTWHGPCVVGTEAAIITRMYTQTLGSAPSQTRLLLASWHTNQASNPRFAWVSMPAVGGALAGLAASGAHRFATGSGSPLYNATVRLETLPDDGGSKASTKDLFKNIYGNEGFPTSSPGGTDPTFTVYTRADAAPTSSAWGTSQSVTTGPTASITPVTTRGSQIEHRVDFLSPNGTATPPKPGILNSIEVLHWRTAPDLDVRVLDVEYGPGILDLYNTDWANLGLSVDSYTDALLSVCRGGRTTIRDRQDNRRLVKFQQVLNRDVDLTEDEYGKVIVAGLVFADLGAA